MKFIVLILLSLLFLNDNIFSHTSIKLVRGGLLKTFISNKKDETIRIKPFLLCDHAVTNEEFKQFIVHNPQWSKGSVSYLLADKNYLYHWTSKNNFPDSIAKKSITNISWYAAKAYCNWYGGMLPTNAQWEFALQKKHRSLKNGSIVSVKDILLRWYENTYSLQENKGIISSDGIKDLVGSQYEWTENFNELIITGDSRGNANQESNLVCGSASLYSKDNKDYSRYIRNSFRTSLKASTTTKYLGFRISYSSKENNP